MRKSSQKRKRFVAPLAGALCAVGFAGAAHAVTYAGNGATGFGGALGNGNLAITTDTSGNITFTLNNASGFSGNDVVVYLDTIAGGFTSNATFSDNQDGGREAVSGTNDGNPSKVNISFPTSFGADYALEFENDTYDGLFQLSDPTNFTYLTGNGPSTTGGPYVVSFPLSDIGLTQGQTFSFVADLISTSAYGSNETIGASTVTPDTGAAPNAGFNGSIAFTSVNYYPSAPVPEPVGLAAICVGGMSLLSRRRQRD